MRCPPRAPNGPNHLGLRALQDRVEIRSVIELKFQKAGILFHQSLWRAGASAPLVTGVVSVYSIDKTTKKPCESSRPPALPTDRPAHTRTHRPQCATPPRRNMTRRSRGRAR